MYRMKKIAALLIALVLISSTVPTQIFASRMHDTMRSAGAEELVLYEAGFALRMEKTRVSEEYVDVRFVLARGENSPSAHAFVAVTEILSGEVVFASESSNAEFPGMELYTGELEDILFSPFLIFQGLAVSEQGCTSQGIFSTVRIRADENGEVGLRLLEFSVLVRCVETGESEMLSVRGEFPENAGDGDEVGDDVSGETNDGSTDEGIFGDDEINGGGVFGDGEAGDGGLDMPEIMPLSGTFAVRVDGILIGAFPAGAMVSVNALR